MLVYRWFAQCALACALLLGVAHLADAQDDKNQLLEAKLATLSDSTQRLPVLLKLAEGYRNSRPVRAISFGREALAISIAHSDLPSQASALLYTGQALRNRVEYDSALTYYTKALALFDSVNDAAGQAETHISAGLVYKNSSRLEDALAAYQQALELAEAAQNKSLQANATLKIAAIHRAFGNKDEQLNYIHKARALALQANDSLVYAKSLYDAGIHCYETTGNLDSTIKLMTGALPLVNPAREGVFYVTLLKGISMLHQFAGETAQAEAHYMQALHLLDSTGVRALKLEILHNLCTFYTNNEQPNKAIELLEDEVIPLAKARHNNTWLAIAYESYAALLESNGQYEDALKYAYLFKSTNDSLVNEARIEAVSEMEQRYQAAARNRQIARQQAAIELAKAENQRKTMRLYATVIIAALLLSLALILVVFFRRQQQHTATLAAQQRDLAQQKILQLLQAREIESMNAMIEGEEQERMRIAADLHDRVGSMLSTVKLFYSAIELHKETIDAAKLERFDKATDLLDDVCAEVRNLAHNMAQGILGRYGLEAALRDLGETLTATQALNVRVLTFGLESRVEKSIEITAYRIVQESLTNVVKHADATEVIVQLNRHPDQLTIVVEDNGKGFEAVPEAPDQGLGLASMQSRVQKLGGTFEIDSQPGTGTSVLATIPIKDEGAYAWTQNP